MQGNSITIWVCIVLLQLFGCTSQQTPASISEINLPAIDGSDYAFASLADHQITVITFFSPECPLSENYTKNLNDLQSVYASEDIVFISVIPGKYYSEKAIDSFKIRYQVQGIFLLDRNKILTNFLQATITPEVFVLNRDGEIQYSGAIDNWAVDLGQKREVITQWYLRDAIDSVLQNKHVPIAYTPPVGCFIE